MRCLCCGEIIDDGSAEECKMRWHKRCVKKFFNTTELPILDMTRDVENRLVRIGVGRGLTVPGVQKKMSLHLKDDGEAPARLTLVDFPTGYIMKPQTERYKNLPEYEWLAMRIAQEVGIKIVPFALYDIGEELVYLTRRIDREFDDESVVRYAMEDFCQLDERLTEDKYKGSYERCVRIVREYSKRPGVDISEIFLRLVVSYVVGNSDMHLKNFSLIETTPGGREYVLSSAYDILPAKLVEPEDFEEMALGLNGKKNGLQQRDFLEFAEYCRIGEVAGLRMIMQICGMREEFKKLVMDSFLPEDKKEGMVAFIDERCERLLG